MKRRQAYNIAMQDTTIAGLGTKNDLCEGLSSELTHKFLLNEKIITMAKGTSLLKQGKPVQHLIILKSGSIQLSLPYSGCEVSWTTNSPDHILGMRSIISGELSEISATCIEPCDIGLIERDFFLATLKAYPEIYFAVSRVLSSDLKIANRMLLHRRQEVLALNNRPRAFVLS